MSCVGNIEFAVLVGVCRQKLNSVKKLKLGKVSLDCGYVAYINSAVAVCIAENIRLNTDRRECDSQQLLRRLR